MSYRSYLLPKLKEIRGGQDGMAEILPGLYIGGIRDSRDSKQMDVHKITHILAVHDDDARKLFKEKKYLIISAADSPKQDLAQHFSHCNDFIHAARLRGGHVLVHCLAGVSRSVTITAAYIMSVTNLNHQEALQAVRSSRVMANPNLGFQKQLYDFENGGANEKERDRLMTKFRPRLANATQMSLDQKSPSKTGGILKKTKSDLKPQPVNIPGRIIAKNTLQPQYDPDDNLTIGDMDHCVKLLKKYQRLVNSGDICAGDCPNDGISCPSGVCRAHLRSASTSFLRKGTSFKRPSSASNSLPSDWWTIWSIMPEDQLRWSPQHRTDKEFKGYNGSPLRRHHSAVVFSPARSPSLSAHDRSTSAPKLTAVNRGAPMNLPKITVGQCLPDDPSEAVLLCDNPASLGDFTTSLSRTSIT